jgi:hypothetical protein
MEELNESQIQNILKAYKKKRESEIKHYHNVLKNNENFKKKNRERAKKWYETNKERRKEYYEENKDLHNAKTLYKYHLKKNNLEYFKLKHKEKYDLLIDKRFIQVED